MEGYEPPETTGGEEGWAGEGDGVCEAAGVCDGCCNPLPALEVAPELELEELADEVDDPLAEPAVELVCPWKDFAAASEIAPVTTTAPAIIHRLARDIRASPASRALVALGFTIPMIGPTRKKLLNRR